MQDKRNIENIVQEIMGLVGEYVNAEIDYRIALNIDVGVRSAEKYSYEAEGLLESKLREFLEQSTVQKPLSDEQMETLIEKHAPPIHPDFSEDDDFDELIRAVERAHGITKGI